MGYKKALMKSVLAFIMLISLSACKKTIYEDLDSCENHYYVKFEFTMNMAYADAFASKVNSISLFIFDAETGDLIDTYFDSGEALSQPGYKMDIMVEPGNYDFVAWCGLENNDNHFYLPETINHRNHANCRMSRDYSPDGRPMQNSYLTPLFHGKVTEDLPDIVNSDYYITIPLIKDTNNINIALQHISGKQLTKDMFTVTMTEDNGHMAHDNTLMIDEDIDFLPWHLADGVVDLDGTGTKADEDDSVELNYFRAEISTPRLMKDRDPRINIIENATGNTIYSIPIVQWALEFRSERYSSMGQQEYLDREDDFNVMLYLDNGDKGWVAASIYINGWRVVKHDDSQMGH